MPDWVVVLVALLFRDFALSFDLGVVLVNVVPVPVEDVLVFAEVLVAVNVLVVFYGTISGITVPPVITCFA